MSNAPDMPPDIREAIKEFSADLRACQTPEKAAVPGESPDAHARRFGEYTRAQDECMNVRRNRPSPRR